MSNFSTCPAGARALGLTFVDLLGGLESTVLEEHCGSEKEGEYGCRALVHGGDAMFRTRCWRSNTNECQLTTQFAKGEHGQQDSKGKCPQGFRHITKRGDCQT